MSLTMRLQHDQTTRVKTTPKAALPGEWLFYFIALVGVIISLLLWYASVLQSNANLERTLRIETQNIANVIEIQFELRIDALEHVASRLTGENGPAAFYRWRNTVVDFINDYGGFQAIAFINASLAPVWLSSNDPAVQKLFDTFLNDNHQKILDLVKNRQTWVSHAVNITNNSKGVFIMIPILNNQEFKGYLVSLVNLDKAINLEVDSDQYAVTIFDNSQNIYQTSPATISHGKPHVASIELYGSGWGISVQPTAKLTSVLRTGLPAVALVLGFCIAVLFAITTRLAQLARQRARSLDKTNIELKIEIAERKAAETSKQRLEKAMLQGQKLQAIGTLAGGIAHDFNNLLYAIIGYVEMSREDVAKDSLIYNNLGKVLEASHRGRELISRILAFSRRQVHEFQSISLKSTIESVLALLMPTVPASVAIDFHSGIDNDFMIYGDPTRLHQVIVNLVNNAVDAMDEDGTVIIKASVIASTDELLQQFPDIHHGNYCKIEIIDSGHGMDRNTTDRIFEPFFTTKEVGKGTGLGLATVHTIVKEHNGEILVQSQLGEGTTFIILIPEYKL
ncbi:MAG: ATP-binding protein [Pseudomonadota bacterium]